MKLSTIFSKAQAVLKDYHEQQIGMKLSKAREELKKLDQAKTFTEYAKAAGRGNSFKTLAEAEKAKKIVGVHLGAGVAPALIELGGLIYEEIQRNKLEKEHAARRTELREALRNEATRIANAAWEEWKLTSDEFRRWIRLQAGAAKTAEEVCEDELQMIELAIIKLGKALVYPE